MSSLPSPTAPLQTSSVWDRIGIWLSSVCAVHCLLMPVLLLALPFWSGGHVLHEIAHPILLVALVPVTLAAMRRSREGALWLFTGLGMVGLAMISHDVLGDLSASALTLLGSLFLITGHRCNQACCEPTENPFVELANAHGHQLEAED
ncbi:MAG: hypothetical protein Rubg2KO_22350 [Rubricoccaceae bacterium]